MPRHGLLLPIISVLEVGKKDKAEEQNLLECQGMSAYEELLTFVDLRTYLC